MINKILTQRGFTLIEALIAMVILTIGIVAVLTMQASFAKGTVDRTVINALIDAAASALNRCQIDTSAPSTTTYTYETITATVTLNPTTACNPPADSCNNVSATASAKGKTFTISTLVCNFN